ncbi:hypothetical protein BGW80DRAFT_687058 [Lactifluus volemus]|nr:hypothetical protein BGW80DRAFT_687058 [Lactifluus volemus]
MSAFDGIHGTACNAELYQQSLKLPSNPQPSIACLTHGQTIGLALAAEACFISVAFIIVIFVLIVRNVLRYRRALPNGDWRLLRLPADIYTLSLLIFDMVMALGGAFDVRWASSGIVTTGSYCSAQGIIHQMGALGVALTILIMAVHTSISAVWGVGIKARRLSFGLMGFTWVFSALWVGLGNGLDKNFQVPAPFWCWISPRYGVERMVGEYLWFWIALFASIITYIPLYFFANGSLSVDEKKWYKFHLRHSSASGRVGCSEARRRDALRLLYLPLSYSFLILPLSVARWSQFSHHHVPSAATFFCLSIFQLSGAANVILLLTVRPRILLFTPPLNSTEKSKSELGRPCAPSLAQFERPTEMRCVDDLEDGSWKSTSGDSRKSELELPSPVSSKTLVECTVVHNVPLPL